MEAAIFSPFSDLSNEVIIHILHCCPYKTILRFSSTCKRNYEIIINSVSLRLHIELEVNGLEVVKSSAMKSTQIISSSILGELHRYRNAWLKPDLNIPVERPVGHPKVLRWELHGGAYFKAYSSFAPQDCPDSLQIIPLDSVLLPPPVKFCTKFHRFTADPSQDLAILVAAIPERFTADPSQDLAILVAAIPERPNYVQLHIRSLATGQPHPQARRPDLTIEFDFEVSVLSNSTVCYAPEVQGSVLAIRFDSDVKRTYEILAWDWKTGSFLHRISSRNGACASRFIDSSYIVVFSATLPSSGGRLLRDVALSIYDISTPTQHNVEGDSHFRVPNYPTLNPTMIFNFPKLRNSHSVFSISFMASSDPVPGRAVYTSSVSLAYSRSITLGLSLSLFKCPVAQNNLGGMRNFRGFVSTSHLLDHLSRHRISHRHPTVLSWDQWGEQATRWFPENEVNLSCSQMSGSRYVTVKHGPNHLPGYHHLVITDFNTPIVQRHQDSNHLLTPYSYKFSRQGDNISLLNANTPTTDTHPSPSVDAPASDAPASDTTVIIMTLGSDAPSTFDSGFEGTFVSRLPCRIIIRVKPEIPHDGWFLDGNRLIGIKNYFGEYPFLSVYDLNIPA
ncbi:unnamed protein product [Rhizoctonia solani]|uniref:F-box domain-containing protein n=1 Tax=Rhizoctonia solani TaxID=456999 RepID=A0A8H3DQ94_9AGAM|nr:unnamed protein product [Rhizoctonia solani]